MPSPTRDRYAPHAPSREPAGRAGGNLAPRVYLSTFLRQLADGRTEPEVEGETVRQLIENLEVQCPGLKAI